MHWASSCGSSKGTELGYFRQGLNCELGQQFPGRANFCVAVGGGNARLS